MMELVKKLRFDLGDMEEPFFYSNDDLISRLTEALYDYSRYRPRRRKGLIKLVPGVTEYELPEDYQTWIIGLSGYEVLGRTLIVPGAPIGHAELSFHYYADHTIESLSVRDHRILLDYCMAKFLYEIVREGAEISGLKLGKGLQINFDNFDKIAQEAIFRQNRYEQSVKKPIGMWT
ncbi:hypothetical protein P4V47_08885 [Brevibacillus laterosporus]|uniref:hypothetical protein n=1 Tax=Brevibacillus laterosporus TaxID=1465 RepID=UPI002E1D789A|nr:hypothetical protein [Brevibacillus laterosporus]